MEENTEKSSKSFFNASQLQIQRLNELWTLACKYRLEGNLERYRPTLLAIYVELSADFTPEQEKTINKIKKDLAELDKLKIKLNPVKTSFKTEEESQKNSNRLTLREKRKRIFNQLLSYEIFLKKCEKAQGKGLKYQDESDEEIQ